MNQIGTLQRPGDTRWSSHFKSICSLLRMFNATRTVLEKIAIDRRATYSQRGDANYALKKLLAFDFVFILHMMQELMAFTDLLCRALQQKSQDILHAMDLLVDTKSSIQDLRDEDMQASYSDLIRSRRNKDNISVEHHYKIDVFTTTMDQQLQELNSRFSEKTTELLVLSASLNPNKGYKNFNVDNICRLAEKYYPCRLF
ncbi:uncharacterized protein LOC130591376 [Beta vulgaris subsp. vulgaris]|uniref:uncharacterized protein LOC130591376 n=1 Tax=Beta vulgaris subsp. vulgaris TaxID=3555 RepID=UPI0025473783|nr:uncharacterized protein LOC130591376 [Beta vulgaris subsp. vulgaris]